MGSFPAMSVLFELKKYRGIIFHENEESDFERNQIVVSKLA